MRALGFRFSEVGRSKKVEGNGLIFKDEMDIQ